MSARTVTVEATATLPDDLKVMVDLGYSTDDPYAVTMRFADKARTTWCVSRELLAEGMKDASGYGDVRVWPSRTALRRYLMLVLSSPEGSTTLRFEWDVVLEFLRRTYLIVPRSEEGKYLDVDAAIEKLLAAS